MGLHENAGRVGQSVASLGPPLAICLEAVFIDGKGERGLFPPLAGVGGMQRRGFGLPMVECSREADGLSRRTRELKTDRDQFNAIVLRVIVVAVMFSGKGSSGPVDSRFLKTASFENSRVHVRSRLTLRGITPSGDSANFSRFGFGAFLAPQS